MPEYTMYPQSSEPLSPVGEQFDPNKRLPGEVAPPVEPPKVKVDYNKYAEGVTQIPEEDIESRESYISWRRNEVPEEKANKEYDRVEYSRTLAQRNKDAGLGWRAATSFAEGGWNVTKIAGAAGAALTGNLDTAKKFLESTSAKEFADEPFFKPKSFVETAADVAPAAAAVLTQIAATQRLMGAVVPAATKEAYAKNLLEISKTSPILARTIDASLKPMLPMAAIGQTALPITATLPDRIAQADKDVTSALVFGAASQAGGFAGKAPLFNRIPGISALAPWPVLAGLGYYMGSEDGRNPEAGYVNAMIFVGLHALTFLGERPAYNRAYDAAKTLLKASDVEAQNIANEAVAKAKLINEVRGDITSKEGKAEFEIKYGKDSAPMNGDWERVLQDQKTDKATAIQYAKAQEAGIVNDVVGQYMQAKTDTEVAQNIANRRNLLFTDVEPMVKAVKATKGIPSLDHPDILQSWISNTKRNWRQEALKNVKQAIKEGKREALTLADLEKEWKSTLKPKGERTPDDRTEETIDAALSLIKAGADAEGLSPDDWVAINIAGVTRAKPLKVSLLQENPKTKQMEETFAYLITTEAMDSIVEKYDGPRGIRARMKKAANAVIRKNPELDPYLRQFLLETELMQTDQVFEHGLELGASRLRLPQAALDAMREYRKQFREVGEREGVFNRDTQQWQNSGKNKARGAVTFIDDGRALIHIFEKADRSTDAHELAHVFWKTGVSGEDRLTVEKWLGVENHKWTYKQKEDFARAFEKYVREGNAPTPELRGVFQRFKQWLTSVYRNLIGSPLNMQMPNEIRAVFGRMLGSEINRIDQAPNEFYRTEFRSPLENFVDPYYAGKPRTSYEVLDRRVMFILREIQKSALDDKQKESLSRGVINALAELKNRDFTPLTFDGVLESVTSGKGKVKGTGPSTAEVIRSAWYAKSNEDALNTLNKIRLGRNTKAIRDISQIREEARVPEGTKEILLSADDAKILFDMMPMKWKEDPEKAQYIREAIGMIRFNLPKTDPEAMSNLANSISDMVADRIATGFWNKYRTAKVANAVNNLSSTRYAISRIARMLADYRFYKNDSVAQEKALRAENEAHDELLALFRDNNVDPNIKQVLYKEPEVNKAMARLLGLDPLNEKHAAALEEANTIINAHPKKAELLKLVSAIREGLQGKWADEVRWLMLKKYLDFWEKNGEDIAAGEAGAKIKGLAELKRKEERMRPAHFNEKTGEAELMDRGDLLRLITMIKQRGERAREEVITEMKSGKYGSKKHYWMVTNNMVKDVLELDKATTDMLPSFDAYINEGEKIASSGKTNHRTGMNALDETTDVIAALFNHIKTIKMQSAIYDEVMYNNRALNEAFTQGKITEGTYRLLMERYINMFNARRPSEGYWTRKIIIEPIYAMNRFFWQSYFWAATRYAWFQIRQVFQGMPFGLILTQHNAPDVAWGYKELAKVMSNKSDPRRAEIEKVYEQDVKQSTVANEEIRMLVKAGEQNPLKGSFKFRDTMGKIAAFGDNFARRMVYGASYLIGRRYAEQLANKEITQGQFEKGLNFQDLDPMQQMRLREMMEEAKQNGITLPDGKKWFSEESLNEVVEQRAKITNENVNGLYRTTHRSVYEQTPLWHLGLSLITFPKIYAEIINKQIIRPMERFVMKMYAGKLTEQDYINGATALRDATMLIASATISSYVGSKLHGEKRDWSDDEDVRTGLPSYGILNTVTQFPNAPGFAMAIDAIVAATTMESSSFKDFLKKNTEKALTLLPVIVDMQNIYETTHNTAGVSNLDSLKVYVSDIIGKPFRPEREFYANRNFIESMHHLLFGTDEYQAKPMELKEALYKDSLIGEIASFMHNITKDKKAR